MPLVFLPSAMAPATAVEQVPLRRIPRVGGWLPEDPHALKKWVQRKVDHVQANTPKRLSVIQDLSDLIYKDPEIYMLFSEMLTEVPTKPPYNLDPSGTWAIRDIETLLMVLDQILSEAPNWNSSEQIGTPINAALCWPMATPAGFAAFLKDNVNAQFKAILNYWKGYLQFDPASCSTLIATDGGWFSASALDSPHMKDFAKNYVCDPSKPYWGYTSWDDFFTRRFREGVRPVASPDDDTILVSAAEAAPFSVQQGVKLVDDFWLKGQPYSLSHMLNNDWRANTFVGGTVYQAFLSADSYHCWHAPVSGTIVDIALVPGTYYSEPLAYSFKPDTGAPDPDPGADENSQGYISAVAARGLIWIQADNPVIGLVCMIMVGMAEVSSIDITMPKNKHFKKGELLGMFHFGGSTHCLVFGPQVQLEWVFPPNLPGPSNDVQIPVCSKLATVSAK